jgi:hypothetical protein
MWSDLSSPNLSPTIEALHLWSQVVGKVRLSLTPWVNHSWHVPLYLSACGLTTGWIPADAHAIDIEFDLIDHVLVIRTDSGERSRIRLPGQSVASFHKETLGALRAVGIDVTIDDLPCEIPDAIPFSEDGRLRQYDPDAAQAYWRALLQVQRVFQRFRTRFVGKHSPIHLFWGSFDLASTRFSGRPAPSHPGGAAHMPDAVARDGYFQEVASAGFWAGGGGVDEPAFYAYAYPAPAGYAAAEVQPVGAAFNPTLGEFVLPYAVVRSSEDPDGALMSFLQSTYLAAAVLSAWDREGLERPEGPLGRPPTGV